YGIHLFLRAFHNGPSSLAKRYERRYGPAAGADLSEEVAKKADDLEKASAGQKAPQLEDKRNEKKQDKDKPSDDKKKDGKAEADGKELEKQKDKDTEQSASKQKEEGTEQKQGDEKSSGDPLETIFKMPAPHPEPAAAASQSAPTKEMLNDLEKPPDDPSSPYVHHFDTYTLVKNLQNGGFTEDQSVTMMNGIRGILARKLDATRNELMSKSEIENESYLFKAASEELRNSIMVSRASEVQSQRTRRAQLQHELDILTQRMNQDLSRLKDDLKEMFNDQKIATRELQRSIDTAIQELNYQITVSLNSDGKSEVEGLRWILTRRAALTIAISAFMSIIALRYHSYKNNKKEKEKQAEVDNAKLAAEIAEAAAKSEKQSLSPEAAVAEPLG
ncbi:hypothetical protein KEM55_007324, partial [Ascosphaera atra]